MTIKDNMIEEEVKEGIIKYNKNHAIYKFAMDLADISNSADILTRAPQMLPLIS